MTMSTSSSHQHPGSQCTKQGPLPPQACTLQNANANVRRITSKVSDILLTSFSQASTARRREREGRRLTLVLSESMLPLALENVSLGRDGAFGVSSCNVADGGAGDVESGSFVDSEHRPLHTTDKRTYTHTGQRREEKEGGSVSLRHEREQGCG
jgi:hypothetical protein